MVITVCLQEAQRVAVSMYILYIFYISYVTLSLLNCVCSKTVKLLYEMNAKYKVWNMGLRSTFQATTTSLGNLPYTTTYALVLTTV